MMTCLDSNIGRVLDLIDEKGLRQNTLIVFMSDNGGPTSKNTSRNDPFTGVKGDVHEGGIRVPCIISWKGVYPEGTVYSQPITSLDLLPTFAAVAGAKLKTDIDYDGTDLSPYLEKNASEKGAPHNTLYWRWRAKKALRAGDYKWLDSRNFPGTKPDYALFNLAESNKEDSVTILNEPKKLDELENSHTKYWKNRFKKLLPGD